MAWSFGKGDQGLSGVLLQLKNLKITLHLLHKVEIDYFSSKQIFEEKSLLSIMMMKCFLH